MFVMISPLYKVFADFSKNVSMEFVAIWSLSFSSRSQSQALH